ncbi:MAG: hypothetical protein KJ823_06965, partial [Proteobacteria bacterium]|nr:hypothetical protein [Pseudomonadota bacterium]
MSGGWDQVKDQIRSDIPKNSFSLWINPISCLQQNETSIVLGCPNRFSKNWVVENYLGLIQGTFKKTGLGHLELQFQIERQKRKRDPSPLPPDPGQLPLPAMTDRRNLWLK